MLISQHIFLFFPTTVASPLGAIIRTRNVKKYSFRHIAPPVSQFMHQNKLFFLLIIGGERSDVDISDQMQIECDLKNSLIVQLQNDMVAFDSCQALFWIENDQMSKKPVQMARRDLKNDTKNQ